MHASTSHVAAVSNEPPPLATQFYMTAACWQSSHFPPFFPVSFTLFSNSAKRQAKKHQSSIRCKNTIPSATWMLPPPLRQWNTRWVYDIPVYDMAAVQWIVAIWPQWAENTDGNFNIQTTSRRRFSQRAPAESRGEITGTKMSLRPQIVRCCSLQKERDGT